MTDTIEITPLSEFAGNLHAFIATLSYGSTARVTPERQRRWQGDHHLFAQLDQALRRRPLAATVSDLPEDILRECVEEVERVRYGEWRLEGDESQPILERLDEHFRPMQEQHAERRREETEAATRRLRAQQTAIVDATERQVDAYRRTWGLSA